MLVFCGKEEGFYKKTTKLLIFLFVTLVSDFFAKKMVVKDYAEFVKGIISSTVSKVSDGDTLIILNADNKFVKISLCDIDAPEAKQEFCSNLISFLASQINGKHIMVDIIDTVVEISFILVILIPVVAIVVISHIVNEKNKKIYEDSEYAKDTGISYCDLDKGSSGEYLVSKVIGQTNGIDKFVIHNLTIKLNERTSQIDHIVIQANGIFVIETKNYAGWINGYENAREWTQTLAYGREKHKLYNPIKQNKSHIYFISSALKEHSIFVPFVVFPKAEVLPDIQGVGDLQDLRDILTESTGVELSSDRIQSLHKKMLKLKNSGNTLKSEHIYNVKKFISDIENNICPRCHKELILKHGKYNKFYGCGNYPNCKFTKPYG
jgi:hypothetical protein